jgi:hypothetical protein
LSYNLMLNSGKKNILEMNSFNLIWESLDS